MDGVVLLFTLAVSMLTGILFGAIPAWNAARADVNGALKQTGRTCGRRTQRLGNVLVIAETALSLVLLAGAGLMIRSFLCLTAADPGFNADRVLTVRVPLPRTMAGKPAQAQYYTRLLEHVRQAPGLSTAGLIAPLPFTDLDANTFLSLEGRPAPAGERQLAKLRSVSPGYFRAMGLTLRRGRVFDDSDGADALPVAVVNESLARRYFPDGDPIGKRVSMSGEGKGPWMAIIGVVKDTKSLSLAAPTEPELYRDYRQFPFAPFATTIVVRTESVDPMSEGPDLQRRIRAANPEQAMVDLIDMRSIVTGSTAQPRFNALLMGMLACIALLLAASGLYGVLSYSVTGRIREIGIRLALGASRAVILQSVLGRAAMLLSAGLTLGLAGAFALTRVLRAELYETNPGDAPTYLGVCLVLAVVGTMAAYLPARRAMRVDPNIALRAE